MLTHHGPPPSLLFPSTRKRTVVHQCHGHIPASQKGRHLWCPHGPGSAHAGDAQYFGWPRANEGVGEQHTVGGDSGVPGGSLHDGRAGDGGGRHGAQSRRRTRGEKTNDRRYGLEDGTLGGRNHNDGHGDGHGNSHGEKKRQRQRPSSLERAAAPAASQLH